MKRKKRHNLKEIPLFYRLCLLLLLFLAVVRWVFPDVMKQATESTKEQVNGILLTDISSPMLETDETSAPSASVATPAGTSSADTDEQEKHEYAIPAATKAIASDITLLPLPDTTVFSPQKRPIYSVPGGYLTNFPDIQDVQYPAASKWGIKPLQNRKNFASQSHKLVYIGSNPYIHLDEHMTSSIPYLVPRASELLEHLGRAFMDSLYAKRIPLHKFVVSSVLRTEADVSRLSRNNVNATQRSCHMFGTTFDISYVRYFTVSHPDGPDRRPVRDDTLKMVLSEVLRDARQEGRCYVRYEIKQPCFHITVR